MKVALVAQPFDGVLPPHQNSIGLIVYHTARQLARKATVAVYHERRGGTGVRQIDGVTFHPVSTRADERLVALAQRVPGLIDGPRAFALPYYYFFYIAAVAAAIRRDRFDIIHLMNFSQFAPIAKWLNPKSKIVLEMQCEWLEQLDAKTVARRLRAVDLVTGDSNHVTSGIKQALPDARVPCITAYNGFDEQLFAPPAASAAAPGTEAPTLLFVGRVSPEKGVHLLLEALPAIVERFPRARLVIAGPRTQMPAEYLVGVSRDKSVGELSAFYDGRLATDYQEYLDRRATELGVAGSIEFKGPLPQSALPDLYRRASVLVNPSFSESFGMSLVEAMATGRPVVATRVGGMKEIVEDGVTGVLVPSGDAAALAAAIMQLLADSEAAREMGRRGCERAAATFSWGRRAEVLTAAYRRLLGGGGGSVEVGSG